MYEQQLWQWDTLKIPKLLSRRLLKTAGLKQYSALYCLPLV